MQKAEWIDFGDGSDGGRAGLGESSAKLESSRPHHGQKLNDAQRKIRLQEAKDSLVVIKGEWNDLKQSEHEIVDANS